MIYLPTEIYIGLREAEVAGMSLRDPTGLVSWLQTRDYGLTTEWIATHNTYFRRGLIEGFGERAKN